MLDWFNGWFGYGLGRGISKAIFGEKGSEGREAPKAPIRQQSEAEIQADEKRYDEDAKRLDAEAAHTTKGGTP